METLDLSKNGLKKLNPTWADDDLIDSLILDDNELSSLEGLSNMRNLEQLSVAKNRIRRMSSLPRLENLRTLDLSKNSIVCIEGLKTLINLKHLNLAGNYIKSIDSLNNNLQLEYLDLSSNAISFINDISYLKELKELYLHENHINSLRQSDRYLPASIEVLTLSENRISDIAEISHLEKVQNLNHLTLKGNPCITNLSGRQPFNYRPYLKMWCLNLTIVDGTPLDPLESLKAEWLYSQGRGRRFRPGNQDELTQFLTTTCPVSPKTSCEDRKLLLILSKAEQYKQQMHNQPGDGDGTRMVVSYHDTVGRHSARASPDLMSRSLDCSVLRFSPPSSHRTITSTASVRSATPLQAASTLIPVPESLVSPDVVRPIHPSLLHQPAIRSSRSPLATPPPLSSPHSTPRSQRKTQRNSPLNSPKSTPTKTGMKKLNSDNVDELICGEMTAKNLHNIQLRASQKRNKKEVLGPKPLEQGNEKKSKIKTAMLGEVKVGETMDPITWKAAISIQRRWRGYRARNLNQNVREGCRTIQAARMQEYIMKVAEDMETTKTALERNRKLQVIQMKAIESVWRKLDGGDLETLATSCLNLAKQVEELRGLVQALQSHGANNGGPAKHAAPVSTQTDIVAVRTPQGDAVFPTLKRPNELFIEEFEGNNATGISSKGTTAVEEPVCLTPACQEGKNLEPVPSPTPSLD